MHSCNQSPVLNLHRALIPLNQEQGSNSARPILRSQMDAHTRKVPHTARMHAGRGTRKLCHGPSQGLKGHDGRQRLGCACHSARTSTNMHMLVAQHKRPSKRLQPGLGRTHRSSNDVRVRAAGTPPLGSPGRLVGRVLFAPQLCAAQLSARRQQAHVTGCGRLCLQAQGADRVRGR